ncbi:DUF3408 domain-containing protein [Prevotella sp. 10(H)]|uniref:DUF3408 domain-containing protein n=1 Tax=Prevotella sp. 10(H) TaxID=1158294 RepID=UPI0004A7665C|nr:DUF3408 domain-containing protein [Prevotella sp. 10(H)]
MNKRKIVQVDEDKLKRMIAGEDETETGSSEKPYEIVPSKKDVEKESIPQSNPVSGNVKKKKQKTDYCELFLKLNKPILKRATTIQLSEDNYRKVGKLLMLTPGVSIAMFMNNILDFHFTEYGDDIDEVIDQSILKLKSNE